MKFTGTIENLKELIESVGFKIVDHQDISNEQRVKTDNGAIVTWYKSTGTLLFQGKPEARNKLESTIMPLISRSAPSAPAPEATPSQNADAPQPTQAEPEENKKIFVVHGHDSNAREQLELILHKLNLNPFVLANTAGGGLTIIETLEQEIGPGDDRARFGIVLLTPDDMGYAKSDGPSNAQHRARQNVVLEMGMLIASIGRTRVAILQKGIIEVPSDAQGILYIPFSDHVRETVPKLVDRLRTAGFDLDPACITNASC